MKTHIAKTLLASGTALAMAAVPVSGQVPGSQPPLLGDMPALEGMIASSSSGALLPLGAPDPERVIQTFSVIVTAYSSTKNQTDDTPFITAAGTYVRDGIVAANFLPIGTKITIPELYGERIFVVEDRMHPRKQWMVDIWFASYQDAVNFGAKDTTIHVLEN